MIDTTAIWTRVFRKNDHKPMNILFGEYHRFNGNKWVMEEKSTNKMRFIDFKYYQNQYINLMKRK